MGEHKIGSKEWWDGQTIEAKDSLIRALTAQRDELKAALDASDEQHREALKQVKALADMLEGLWGLRVESKTGLWRIDLDDEEAAKVTAVLRLSGRLK